MANLNEIGAVKYFAPEDQKWGKIINVILWSFAWICFWEVPLEIEVVINFKILFF